MRVVVTGGAGFIGSHLAKELLLRGRQVCVVDDLSTGKKERIDSLLQMASREMPPEAMNLEFVRGSVTDLSLLQKVFRGVDYVFHQAAIPSVTRSVEDPLTSHQANVTGTVNVLVAAKDNRVKKVVFASSSSVYGESPSLPKREDMPANPQSPYAAGKLAGEYYCQVFGRIYGLGTACLRYFNVYGPGQDPESQYAAVVPRFIKLVSEGKPPVIFGDGEQTRDFTFVKDVVNANILAAESDVIGNFNVGTGKRVSINYVVKVITGSLKKDLKPLYKEERAGDIRHSLADVSKAMAFGYSPKWTLEKGLMETVRSFNHRDGTVGQTL
ncbi:MAG: SDR family oxidoreductase [Chloroflexi bacterium]|nr:SDR family oxidoreductase [Chloroflexota bacterium]